MNEHFFDPLEEIRTTENRLPHWEQAGRVYSITFRLADALPTSLQEGRFWELQNWHRYHPQPWSEETRDEYYKRFAKYENHLLDQGHGSCQLRQQQCQDIVEECLQHYEGTKYRHVCWVIMPNHVHLLTQIFPEHGIGGLVKDWKGVSAHFINAKLQRKGTFWQKDYWDRLIRDESHFIKCIEYVRNNPRKAKLPTGTYRTYENEICRQ